MEKKIRKIGIGFITGRKSFREVLSTYLNCWGDKILSANESVELSLFVAYDLEYNNTQPKDYTDINIKLKEMLSGIYFIDREDIRTESQHLHQEGVLTEKEATHFFEKGYAGKRNTILYFAAKYGMDAILFLDDDEYPLMVQNTNGVESWSGQQILSTHMKYIEDADITCGDHCGYISPIPNIPFNDVLTEDDFRLFIEAISNDILNWDNLKALMKKGSITYADPKVFSGKARIAEQINHTKFISGSNLCINLSDLSRLSPFYNPPFARGEDTFLSTCLEHNKVLRVPCYTFHDGFLVYSSMLKGVLPRKLEPVSVNSKKILARFYSACIGWVRYKPLLVYITNREAYRSIIDDMKSTFKEVLPKLSEYFDNDKFMKISEELDKYDKNVEKHYKAFEATKKTWQKLVLFIEKENTREN